MSNFKKVLILADKPFENLAQRTYDVIINYSKITKTNIPGGIHKFNPEDLVIDSFANQETHISIQRTVRGRDVFLLKSFDTYNPKSKKYEYNPNLGHLEINLIADAVLRAGASSITLVAPYIPYLRQDRYSIDKKRGVPKRESLSARAIADDYVNWSLKGLITIDPHFLQFVDCFPRDFGYQELPLRVETVDHMLETILGEKEDSLLYSPDFGGALRAKLHSNDSGIPLGGLCDKFRPIAGQIESVRIFAEGNVKPKGKKGILVDDLIDTGTTLIMAANELKKSLELQDEVLVYAPHGIFTKGLDILLESRLKPIVSESIPIQDPRLDIIPIHRLLGIGIHHMITGESIGETIFSYPKFKQIKQKLNGN